MEKEKPAFLHELKKRPPEKPLTLNELSALREISHKYLKEDTNALELLIQYCKHPKFQIRMCEKAYLILTINPLMQLDNSPDVIKYGAWALSLLSENPETHKKIMNSGALPTLSTLILNQIHYEINKYSIITIANLASTVENYGQLMGLDCRDFIILKFLDSSDNDVQYHILKFILGLCNSPECSDPESKLPNIRKILIMTNYLEPVLRCAVSPDTRVASITLELLRCLITSEKNQGKLMSFNLTGKLYHLYHSLKTAGNQNIMIMNAIAKIFRALLKYSVNQVRLARERYIRLLLDFLSHADFDLPLNAAICLSHMSEKIESHEKLVDCGVLDLMVTILKETKHPKLYRQACRFMANLSWNAKYQQILLDKEVIDFLLGSLGTVDKWTLSHSVTTIANLSCKSNFHENTKHKNIKYLIHVLDSNADVDDKVLEAASMALANLSADFYYHEHLLKEPEITMILKILNEPKEGRVIEHILALITNLTTNPSNANKLFQKHVFEALVTIMEVSKNRLLGFIAKSIAGLSILSKVRQKIIDHKLIYHLINTIYITDADVQQQILVSLLTLLATSDDFHGIFLQERGLAVLEHFLNKHDHFFVYVACKMLAILSRSKDNLVYLLKPDLVESIFQCGFTKNYMILKESLRFFTQCMINQKCQLENDFISKICKLAYEGLQFMHDNETVDLALLSLAIMSQNDTNIPEIAKHIEIFKYLSDKPPADLNKHAQMLIMLIMNLSMAPDNHHMLVKFKFINLFNEMIEGLDEICHSHILTILIQIFKHEFTEEIFGQHAHQIIIKLLEKDYPHFKSDIIKLINTILEGSITYPEELLGVIHYLSLCPDEEEFTQKDNELLMTQTNVLAKFSFNDTSMSYFKKSEIVKLMYKILGQEKPEKVIILNCIIILSNISQDQEILNEILKHKVEDILKLSNLKLPFNLKKPFIRILTFMTISNSFNPRLIPNSAINLLFDIVRTYRSDQEGILVPCIICLINLTTMGYDVIYSFSKKGLIHHLYEIIKDQDLDANVISSAIIIIANMMITKQIYDENKFTIDEIIDFANNLLPSASSTHPLILSNILKFIHNLIIIDTSILSAETANSIILKSINIFVGIADSGTRSVILSILNFMIEKNETYQIIIQNQKFLENVLTISFEEKSSFASYDLRTGALALLSIISQHNEGIDFIKKNLNYKEFMDNLVEIYQDNSSDQTKEYMLLILANLCYEKTLIKSLLTKQDHFNFLYTSFVTIFSTKYDALLETTFKLAINLSADSTINHFLAKEKLLKILNQIFFQPSTTKHIKDLIQIFLSNLSFNQANHPDMIKNECIKIFEQYDALNVKKELDKYALTSLANLALNSNNFYLLENELNMINTLSLIDDFDKPIQIKLLNSAIEYVTDEEHKTSKNPPESKKALFIEIFASINSMLETKSLFLIKYCTDMLYRISKTNLGLNVQYDSQALMDNLVEIILRINKKDIKYSNFHNLCLVSKSTLFFESITNTQTLQKLFEHSARAFKTLRESKEEVPNQLELEYDIIFFLKFLSNCAIYGKKNKALGIFLINKDLEDSLFNIMIFSNKHSANLLSNIMCSYANMFHSENVSKFYNYGRIFDHLHNYFKKFVKSSPKIENFILGLVSLILKGKNYNLSDFNKMRPSHNANADSENHDQSFMSNFSKKSSFKPGTNLFKFPTNETDNDRESLDYDSKSNVNESLYKTDIFSNEITKERKIGQHNNLTQQVFKSYSLRGNEEYDIRGRVKLDKDLQFVFKFLFYIIKKHIPHSNNSKMMSPNQPNVGGGELKIPQNNTKAPPLISPNRLSANNQSLMLNEGPQVGGNDTTSTECETFQLFSNLACNIDNQKVLLGSKLTEHLLKYLKNDENMVHEAYKYALTCTLNLAMNKDFYRKIKSHELILVLMKLFQNNKPLFLEYSSVFLLLMVENDTSDDFYNSMDDFINIINSNVQNLDKAAENYKINLTKILSLLENTIKIARLKYKIAKIPLIFETVFNIILTNDQTKPENFKETNSFMAILTLFADSKECMSYLIKYGIYDIIKANLQYLNQANYLDFKSVRNPGTSAQDQAKQNEMSLTIERLKFLTNLLNLLDACLELENNSTAGSKLKLKVVKDKRVTNSPSSDEVVITFANIYDSMEMAVLDSFIENNSNLILLTETCLHMTNILMKLRSSNFESVVRILTMITKISKKKKVPYDGESVNQFDNIINALYQIQEKCYTLYEFEIGDIVKLILNIYNSKDTNFLRRSSYLCFNKILVKLDFRKLDYSLDSDIKEIMTMLILNNTEFNDVIYQYYATLIIRKIVVLYEISPSSQIFEELLEFSDMIIDSIKKFSNSLSSNLSKIEENTHMKIDLAKRKSFAVANDKNKKDIEKLYIVLVLETIIILYKFKDLHFKFVSAEVLKSVVRCAQKISEINSIMDNRENAEMRPTFNFTNEDLVYITRVVSLILYEASYFSDTYEDLLSKPVVQFMVTNLTNPLKSIHTSIYNTLTNVFAIGNATLIPMVLDEVNNFIDEFNQKAVQDPKDDYSNLIPVIGILDFFYDKIVKEIGKDHQFAVDELTNIVILLTNLYAEKTHLEMPKSVLGKLLEQSEKHLYVRTRTFMLIVRQTRVDKFDFTAESQRDGILDLILKMIKKDLSNIVVKQPDDLSEIAKFSHQDFMTNVLEKGIKFFEEAASVENIFFWEYYCEDIKDDDLNIICTVLALNLLAEISQVQFFSQYLSELYILLDNINSRLNTMKTKTVIQEYYEKFLSELIENFGKNNLIKKS